MAGFNSFDDMLNDLRRSEPYLSDEGFTSAVMAGLPESQELPLWLKNFILLGFTALGSAIATWELPLTDLVTITTSSLLSLPVLGIAGIAIFLFSYFIIWMVETGSI